MARRGCVLPVAHGNHSDSSLVTVRGGMVGLGGAESAEGERKLNAAELDHLSGA